MPCQKHVEIKKCVGVGSFRKNKPFGLINPSFFGNIGHSVLGTKKKMTLFLMRYEYGNSASETKR